MTEAHSRSDAVRIAHTQAAEAHDAAVVELRHVRGQLSRLAASLASEAAIAASKACGEEDWDRAIVVLGGGEFSIGEACSEAESLVEQGEWSEAAGHHANAAAAHRHIALE